MGQSHDREGVGEVVERSSPCRGRPDQPGTTIEIFSLGGWINHPAESRCPFLRP